MPLSDQHVVPLPGDAWGVTTEGSDEYTNVYHSKADAIDAAISIAQRDGVDLIVHGKSGQPFLSPPGSSLDEYSLRHITRSLGPSSRSSGRKAAKVGGSSRKSSGASAKKSVSAGRKGGSKKSGGLKATARKSATGRGSGAKKSAAKSASARKSSGKARGRR